MRNAILAIVATVMLAVPAFCTDVTVGFSNVDTDHQRAAAWKLAQVNAVRVAHELEPYANVQAMLVDHILNVLVPQWIAQEAEAKEQEQSVQDLWRNATDAQRAAAIAALQS